MRLADFTLREIDSILANWEAFAATRLPAARRMSGLELRDDAKQILEAVAADLSTTQTREEQAAKSMGLAPVPFPARETAAQTHAVLRAKSGFDIKQLASEYRALRASVLRLWMDACQPADPPIEDVIRFDEAIDQALAESIACFSAQVEQSRNLLIGMLSHDMRSPLQTIQATSVYLGRLNASSDISDAARRLIRSGARMQALLDDLVDFNRTNLGLGINIVPSQVDLGELCAEELQHIRTAHPECPLELTVTGDCSGLWDPGRVQQLVGNLVENAMKYGATDEPIRVAVLGEDAEVRIEVANQGPAIDSATLLEIFEPLKRGEDKKHQPGTGLGLYIVREIAKAHRGSAEVRSDDETVFIVHLPRSR
jgi:signal transduction histidine kinase